MAFQIKNILLHTFGHLHKIHIFLMITEELSFRIFVNERKM